MEDIVYALYGPARSPWFDASNRTWLRDRQFVYIPDARAGPFAANFRPVHEKGTFLGRTKVDANMLWAAHLANRTYPDARWVMVVDSDCFVMPATVAAVARARDWRQPAVLGIGGNDESSRNTATCEGVKHCQRHNGDGNFNLPRHGGGDCCMCPVMPANDTDPTLVHHPNGTAFYRPASRVQQHYGGTGILLSKGLLNAIPSDAWELCTRRLACGSADFRLVTCIVNLLDRVTFVSVDASHKFLRQAFDADAAARRDFYAAHNYTAKGSMDVYFNEFWSVIHKDPVARVAILSQLRTNTTCPWSMHKLHGREIAPVYEVAQHCM